MSNDSSNSKWKQVYDNFKTGLFERYQILKDKIKVHDTKTILVLSILVLIIVGFGIVVFIHVRKRKQEQYIEERREYVERICKQIPTEESIFVSIPSYRDPECAQTVFDCFQKAACPRRVFIGVCQQNYPVDADVLEGYKTLMNKKGIGNYINQLRIYSVDASKSEGPMLARSWIETNLYRGETFYLTIDSHMIFGTDWDVRAIDMFKQCLGDPSVSAAVRKKPILTMYPEDFTSRSKKDFEDHVPSYLRFKKFNVKSGLPEIEGPMYKTKPSRPLPSLFWGACFSFGLGLMITEVPFDPHCHFVFMGEEIAMAARYYTHGYDLYSPTSMLILHRWERLRPTFWEQLNNGDEKEKRQRMEVQGYNRLKLLFGLRASDGTAEDRIEPKYGLGSIRSLKDYETYCGINFLLQTANEYARIGVTRNATSEEILCKMGSMSAYYSAIKK